MTGLTRLGRPARPPTASPPAPGTCSSRSGRSSARSAQRTGRSSSRPSCPWPGARLPPSPPVQGGPLPDPVAFSFIGWAEYPVLAVGVLGVRRSPRNTRPVRSARRSRRCRGGWRCSPPRPRSSRRWRWSSANARGGVILAHAGDPVPSRPGRRPVPPWGARGGAVGLLRPHRRRRHRRRARRGHPAHRGRGRGAAGGVLSAARPALAAVPVEPPRSTGSRCPSPPTRSWRCIPRRTCSTRRCRCWSSSAGPRSSLPSPPSSSAAGARESVRR